jgi:hypothetical protein
MKNLPGLFEAARGMPRAQRRIALAVLVGLLLVVPSLPALLMVPTAAVATWIAAQPLLVGMVLGAVGVRRRRIGGAK